MLLWAILVASGSCTFASFYMAFLTFRAGADGIFLFALSGLFWGAFSVVLLQKQLRKKESEKPVPVTFVSHWFLVTAISFALAATLAAIIFSIAFK